MIDLFIFCKCYLHLRRRLLYFAICKGEYQLFFFPFRFFHGICNELFRTIDFHRRDMIPLVLAHRNLGCFIPVCEKHSISGVPGIRNFSHPLRAFHNDLHLTAIRCKSDFIVIIPVHAINHIYISTIVILILTLKIIFHNSGNAVILFWLCHDTKLFLILDRCDTSAIPCFSFRSHTYSSMLAVILDAHGIYLHKRSFQNDVFCYCNILFKRFLPCIRNGLNLSIHPNFLNPVILFCAHAQADFLILTGRHRLLIIIQTNRAALRIIILCRNRILCRKFSCQSRYGEHSHNHPKYQHPCENPLCHVFPLYPHFRSPPLYCFIY